MKQKVLIVGAGEGGSTLLRLLQSSNLFQIIGIIDINPIAKGLQMAKEYGIAIGESVTPFLSMHIDVMFDMTGDDDLHKDLLKKKHKDTLLIPGDIAKIVTVANSDKESEDAFKTNFLLSDKLNIPFLYLCNGSHCRKHRLLGPLLGSCMYLCLENSKTCGPQPTIEEAKVMREKMQFLEEQNG